ncbi:MAG: BACON domain-containing protein [Bacteroidales bacterium]|nr:BACON domain-containing protein [Bacteroidales bacterium]
MRHISFISIALSAVVLLAACEKAVESEREKLDSRESSVLDVQYALDGQVTKSLSLPHQYARPVIQVTMNSEGLKWNMESDRDWCKVVQEPHQGSGSFTLEVEANESFEAREPATLTFKAGDFRGFRLQVDQNASSFIISQPFFIADATGGTFAVEVTAPESAGWKAEAADGWLSVSEKSTSGAVGGQVTKTLQIQAQGADNDSRLGSVKLSAGAEEDLIYIWQFGRELDWKDGRIFFAKDKAASLSMIAPGNLIKEFNLPDYATCSEEAVDGQLNKYVITLDNFLSDASSIREVALSVTLNNNSATVVSLPPVAQDYTPAGALLSAEGLKAFAQKVAEGASTADWENAEGWVTLMQDIDMSGVKDWPGIGTRSHPFAGKFDGKGFAVKKLSASSHSIFNICKGAGESDPAIIKDFKIDNSCSFYSNQDGWNGEVCFAALVAEASNTRIENCVNSGSVDLAGQSDDDSPAYLGGILGKGGSGVTLRNCRTSDCTVSLGAYSEIAYLGGIAGVAPVIRGCSMSAALIHEGQFTHMYMGGITGLIGADETLSGNSFSGRLSLKGNSRNNYMGGLYGAVKNGVTRSFDASSDMSTVAGEIQINSYLPGTDTRIYAGGFLGYAAPGATLSFTGYEIQTRFVIENSVNRSAGYCCGGGVLGGCNPDDAAGSLTFTNISSQGSISINFGSGSRTGVVHSLYGGVAGFINGAATFTGCVNKGDIGVKAGSQGTEGASFNGSLAGVGGMVGVAEGGNISFKSCTNQALVTALFYVNNVPVSTSLSNWVGEAAGGMIGLFNLKSSASARMTVEECNNLGTINAYRGFAGGIAGFCQNASMSQCTNISAVSTTSNGYIQGGIAGCVIGSSFSNCTAKTGVRAGAGGNANDYGCNAGGILGRVEGNAVTTVTACSYYGTIDAVLATGKPRYGGGLAGYATAENSSFSNCRFGGEVNGADVKEAKLAELAIGGGGATAPGTTLWNGN